MLQFVIGGTGAEKSRTVCQKIIEDSIKHPEKQYFVLTPEQSSLETQKALVALHPGKGILNIDTLSFMRLAYRIFNETGVQRGIMLDDAGKTLIVRRVLTQKRSELGYFAANSSRQGFCAEMKSVLSELMQYGIDVGKLDRMIAAAEDKTLLRKKLEDVSIVYKGFREFLQDRFITSEDIYTLFADAAGRSKLLRGATVVLDGYTGFTPSQYCLLEALMRYCDKVYVTITMDAAEFDKVQEEHELFHLSFKTMEVLRRLAAGVHCAVEEPMLLGSSVHSPMDELEHTLFRKQAVRLKNPSPVEICAAVNPVDEVKSLICEIKKSLHEGLRFKEMAVITGALEEYAPIFNREFENAGIPAFLDYKREITSDPVVELLRAVLELSETGWSYESVMRVLKCILFKMDEDGLDELDNYILATGIRGKSSWKHEWHYTWKKPHPPELELLNRLREEVLSRLLKVSEVLEDREATVSSKVQALREFMAEEAVSERLAELCVKLEQQNLTHPELYGENALLIKEYDQITGITEEIFARLEELLGDELLSGKDFRELIETGFREVKVGVLPQGMDRLVVGDVERSRISGIKRLFFVGVNEGIIPPVGTKGGILSDSDRSFFADAGIELAPTMREKAYTEEFYLYLNLTKPSESIYISYSLKSGDEKPILPSYLIAKLKAMYLDLKERVAGTGASPEYLLGSDKGLSAFISLLRDLRGEEKSLDMSSLQALAGLVPLSEEAKRLLMEACFYRSPEQKLRSETARRLYGDTLFGSISRLEEFAKCNLKHYLDYGLKLKTRREYEVSLPDMGTVFHSAMENCSIRIRNEGKSFKTITDEECDELAGWSSLLAAQEFNNGILMNNKRSEYLVSRIRQVVLRTLMTTRYQLGGSEFEPEFFEEKFSYDRENLKLLGTIDRLDVSVKDDKVYAKIVDYKSGNTTLDITNVYYGLQLQLGVYLGAAIKLLAERYPEYKTVPAAIFYYHLKNPFVEYCETPEKAIMKELVPDGLVNADKSVVTLLDEELHSGEMDDAGNAILTKSFNSSKIPVATDKESNYKSYAKVAEEKALTGIIDYLDEIMCGYAKDIMAGEASANPVSMAKQSGCKYCDYRDICAFGSLSGIHERKLKKIDKEEAWAQIGQNNSKM